MAWSGLRRVFPYRVDVVSSLAAKDGIEQGRQAFRASVEVVDEGSFYDYTHLRSDDLLLAYEWAPSNDTSWSLSFEYGEKDLTIFT